MLCSSSRRRSSFDQPTLVVEQVFIKPSVSFRDLRSHTQRLIQHPSTPFNYDHRWHAKLFATQRTYWCYQEWTTVTRCIPTRLSLQQCDSSQWSIWLPVLCLDAPDLITTDFTRDYLHWLPIQQRVDFKICSMVYKAQHDLSPSTWQKWWRRHPWLPDVRI